MLSQQQQDWVSQSARIAQLINGAMIGGVFVFAGVVAATMSWEEVETGFSFLATIAAGAALVMIVMSFILPAVVRSNVADVQAHELKNRGGKEADEPVLKKFGSLFVSSHLVRIAMLEGAAFLNLAVFFVDKRWISLCLVGVLLFGLVVSFPTLGRVFGWVENQVRVVDEQLKR